MTLSFYAEHPLPDQPSSAVSTRLSCYNSKNSKLNRSASLFKQKRKLNYIQELLLEALTKPARWLNFPLVAVLAKIFTTTKTSLLAEPPLRVGTVIPLLLLRYVFPLSMLYMHLSLLYLFFLALPISLWLGTWRMTSSGLSWPSLRPDLFFLRLLHLFQFPLLPPLRPIKAYVSSLWKLGFWTFIGIKLTWNVTITSSSAKIILQLPVLRIQTEFRLRLFSWRIPPCSAGSNNSVR